jgi:C-terminal processing protease CtpA/Prc
MIYLSGSGKAGSDMNAVGLTLRPESDGRYTILSVIEVDGKPAVSGVKAGDVLLGVDGAPVAGATMGQVWSLLGGDPGQVRKLVVERGKERMTVEATVQRFLPTVESVGK